MEDAGACQNTVLRMSTPRINLTAASWGSRLVPKRYSWDFNAANQRNCCALKVPSPSKALRL
eukprot:8665542-Pyramimonas_sp.AAC.1